MSFVQAAMGLGNPYLLNLSSGQMIKLPTNPDSLSYQRNSEWHQTPQPEAIQGSIPQFQGSNGASLSAKFTLYKFSVFPPVSLETLLAMFDAAVVPSEESVTQGDPKPPTFKFGWGTRTIMEEAYLESFSVDEQHTHFWSPALLDLSFTLRAVPAELPGTNPTSGALASRRTRTVVAGDTLASVAFAEYGDPAKWRAVAIANNIDDPMRVKPGTLLVLPEPGEAETLL